MKYCEFCGKELKDNERCSCPEAEKKRSKSVKWIKILAPIAGIAILAAIIVIVALLSAKIDPFDYVTVSYDGYSGNGTVAVSADIDAMVAQILGEASAEDSLEEQYEWMNLQYVHADNITVSHTPSEGLSNGDEVVVTVEVVGDTAKKIKSTSKTFTVEGLTEVELVDVFAEVTYEYKGMDGEGFVTVTPKDTADAFIDDLSFYVGGDVQNGCLSNGDSITVTVSCSDSIIEMYSKVPKEKTTTVVVEGLGTYATPDDLNKEDIQEIADRFVSETQSKLEDDGTFTYSDAKLCGVYFAEAKEDKFTSSENGVHVLVEYARYMDGKLHSNVCYPLIFEDLVVSEDGAVEIDYDRGHGTGFSYDNAEEYLDDLSEKYIVTEIE